jgi:hypothetical protein
MKTDGLPRAFGPKNDGGVVVWGAPVGRRCVVARVFQSRGGILPPFPCLGGAGCSPHFASQASAARQSIGGYLRDVLPARAAACFSLPRLGGKSAPAGAREGAHSPALVAAYFSLGVVSAGRLGKVCGFAVGVCPPLPHPLPPSGGEGIELGAFAPKDGGGLPRRYAPRNDGKVGGAGCSRYFGMAARNSKTNAHGNAANRQTFVIASAARQSIGGYLCTALPTRAAACFSLPRPAGERARQMPALPLAHGRPPSAPSCRASGTQALLPVWLRPAPESAERDG